MPIFQFYLDEGAYKRLTELAFKHEVLDSVMLDILIGTAWTVGKQYDYRTVHDYHQSTIVFSGKEHLLEIEDNNRKLYLSSMAKQTTKDNENEPK